jgi:NAD(P)-dependent dehydrogenase (short-subunit alcohol dehydrogenase family)
VRREARGLGFGPFALHAEEAVETAIAKFGRIDILVNNAGNFFAGFFEELSPQQVRNQIETLLFRPMNVTRAGLLVVRKSAKALVTLVGLKDPPARFAAGADAVRTFEAKANTLLAQAQSHRELSASLAHDDA